MKYILFILKEKQNDIFISILNQITFYKEYTKLIDRNKYIWYQTFLRKTFNKI